MTPTLNSSPDECASPAERLGDPRAWAHLFPWEEYRAAAETGSPVVAWCGFVDRADVAPGLVQSSGQLRAEDCPLCVIEVAGWDVVES